MNFLFHQIIIRILVVHGLFFNKLWAFKCKEGYNGAYCDECGLYFFDKNVKIIGGNIARPNSWPSIALVIFKYKFLKYDPALNKSKIEKVGFQCGGNLIDRETILTAGHCLPVYIDRTQIHDDKNLEIVPNSFYPTYESMFTVYLGLHEMNEIYTNSTNRTVVIANVIEARRHRNFNKYNALNDIAILRIKEVKLNEYIQVACLPPAKSFVYPGTYLDAYAAGWGLNDQLEPSSFLHNVKLKIFNGSDCNTVDPDVPHDWSSQICAGDKNGKKAVCNGDSGGPLFFKTKINNKTKYILVGLTSYSSIDGCNVSNKPKVSYFIDWIYNNTNQGKKVNSSLVSNNGELSLIKPNLIKFYNFIIIFSSFFIFWCFI